MLLVGGSVLLSGNSITHVNAPTDTTAPSWTSASVNTNTNEIDILGVSEPGIYFGLINSTSTPLTGSAIETAVAGSELITNGNFSAGISNWSAHNSAIMTTSSSKLSVDSNGTLVGNAYQAITTVVGKKYVLIADVIPGTNPATVAPSTTPGDLGNITSATVSSQTTITLEFTATGTTTYIRLGRTSITSGDPSFFNNVTVREILQTEAAATIFAVNPGTTSGTIDKSGVTNGVRYLHGTIKDLAGNYSTDIVIEFTQSDTTAPVLTSPTDAANGANASTASVTTDEANGVLYTVVTTSATTPSAAQVKAGQDNTGAAAAFAGNQTVTATGIQTVSPAPSGLSVGTSYRTHFMHEDAAGNQSSVASAAGFTTTIVPGFIRAQSDVTNGTGITYTFTGASLPATKIAVSVFVPGASGIALSSVTIGGVAATKKLAIVDNFLVFEIWEASVGSGNSGTIDVTTTAAALATRCGISVHAVPGLIYQTGTTFYNVSTTVATLSTNTSAGDYVIFHTFNAGGSAVTPSGYTEDFDGLVESPSDYHEGGHNPSATGGTPEVFTATIGSAAELGGISAVYR